MERYIILLRGVNVGGKNLLPMKELRVYLEEEGFKNVNTYIQSGNVVLMWRENPKKKIANIIKKKFGFEPAIVALSKQEFDVFVMQNPFKEFDGKLVHFYFCKESPKLDSNKLNSIALDSEKYLLAGNVFYLHAPNGIGRSKLAASIEKCLGVPATGRNLNTVNKLSEMLKN